MVRLGVRLFLPQQCPSRELQKSNKHGVLQFGPSDDGVVKHGFRVLDEMPLICARNLPRIVAHAVTRCRRRRWAPARAVWLGSLLILAPAPDKREVRPSERVSISQALRVMKLLRRPWPCAEADVVPAVAQ